MTIVDKLNVSLLAKNANNAQSIFSKIGSKQRAVFLSNIIDNLNLQKNAIVQQAMEESNLPEGRIQGEFGRTIGQIQLFVDLINQAGWNNAKIELANPDRTPIPKPDTRSILVPIGPVLVFGASNFPLAFSTIGGDSVSALAAGNAVIYKANPAHPKTSNLVFRCIQKALSTSDLPLDTFQHISSNDFDEVKTLVQHPILKAVAFTGSLKGGMAIYNYAQERVDPIPVFAEMGSLNPVLFLASGLNQKEEYWSDTFVGSFTLGCGQFCTKPGLMIGMASSEWTNFKASFIRKAKDAVPQKMLTNAIANNYAEQLNGYNEVDFVVKGNGSQLEQTPSVISIDGITFLNDPQYHEECFGPFTVLVTCSTNEELEAVVHHLEGQLTATLIADEADTFAASLFHQLVTKAGRVMLNCAPTGVEVNQTMVHGGPFPATTDSRYTSVGSDAIYRFVRPVCFQNIPESWLPNDLNNKNGEILNR